MRFFQKLQQRIINSNSLLCVGIDPRFDQDVDLGALEEQLLQLIIETSPYAAAFKPNIAYFEALGSKGWQLLEKILPTIANDIPIVLDVKRGDIGETQKYYAMAYFEQLQVDAVTLNPFMGWDTIEPFLSYRDKGLYLLALTSNAGSNDIEKKQLASQQYVFEEVVGMATRENSNDADTAIGFVVGLTNPPQMVNHFNSQHLLMPGLGAQNGDLTTLQSRLQRQQTITTLINVSRGISQITVQQSYGERAAYWQQQINFLRDSSC